jgi:hypothetical protein
MLRALSLALVLGLTTAAAVKADQLGCTVLLCTSPGAPPWQSIPECVQPVTTAYWMAENGMGWPQCPEAAGGHSMIERPPEHSFRQRLFESSSRESVHADFLSRVRALICAMRIGPRENSPAPAFRVSSRK